MTVAYNMQELNQNIRNHGTSSTEYMLSTGLHGANACSVQFCVKHTPFIAHSGVLSVP